MVTVILRLAAISEAFTDMDLSESVVPTKFIIVASIV